MVGRGVHFLWRGSFTRRIISVQSSCNLSRKKNKHTVNETRRRAKNKNDLLYILLHSLGITLHFLWFNLGGSFWKEENRKTSCQMPEECSFLWSSSPNLVNKQTTRNWELRPLVQMHFLFYYIRLVTWNTWFFYYFTLPFVFLFTKCLETANKWSSNEKTIVLPLFYSITYGNNKKPSDYTRDPVKCWDYTRRNLMQAAESLFISKSFKSAPIKRMKIRREL